MQTTLSRFDNVNAINDHKHICKHKTVCNENMSDQAITLVGL